MSKQKMLTAGALAALCVFTAFTMRAHAAGQEGMVVVRDTQTGKLRAPTAEEARALQAKTPAAALAGASRPTAIAGRAGARGVRLGENSMVYEVVTRDADGKLSGQCLHGDEAAHDALHRSSAQANREHDHEVR